jgi:hypothetical protein
MDLPVRSTSGQFPTAGKLVPVKNDELLNLLGMVTQNGQGLEVATCLVFGRCLRLPGGDADALRVGQRLPMVGRLDLIAELSKLDGCPLDRDKLRVWVLNARKANEKRNAIIHSGWLGDPATGEFRGALAKGARLEPSWGRRELREAISALHEAATEAVALLGRSSEPPPREETEE